MFGRGAIAAVTVRVTSTVLAGAQHLGHRMPPGIPGQDRGERRPVYVSACQPAAQDAQSHLAAGQHRGAPQPALAAQLRGLRGGSGPGGAADGPHPVGPDPGGWHAQRRQLGAGLLNVLAV